MDEPELEISRTGIKVRRLTPVAMVIVIAMLCETVVSISAMWRDTDNALTIWRTFTYMVAVIIGVPLATLIGQALRPQRPPER
jgi:hypothetical protein